MEASLQPLEKSSPEQIAAMQADRANARYLKDLPFPDGLQLSSDLDTDTPERDGLGVTEG